jgi:hypothetical protein
MSRPKEKSQPTSSGKGLGRLVSKCSPVNKFQIFILVTLFAAGGVAIKLQSDASGCYGVTFVYGSSGRCVRDIQQLINWAPYGPKLTVDGKYDASTKTAVQNYQKPMGLTADGVVGPKTWKLICQPQTGPSVPPSWPRAAAHDAGCPGW